MSAKRTYIAIDLKSFYASVECVERELNPLTTNLVVADPSRTEKTICLAVSPSLKAYGISGRARLFEVVQRMSEINADRKRSAPEHQLARKSVSDSELKSNPELEVDYIIAPPRMSLYIDYSVRIYKIYLRYIAPEDIHVYSVDEIFCDATNYLKSYRMTGHQLAMKMVKDVLHETSITATAGIGTNLYLSKIAMDIVAKHIPADADGVRIAELDEMSYRRQLWDFKPLTKFWRVGHGIAERLASYGIATMGQIARCSIDNEELLYKLFGINAELLIDHAWGWEPCTIAAIKAYKPETNSLSNGQVLQHPYDFDKARVVAREMADSMALNLVDKHLVTNQVVLYIGYDTESLTDPIIRAGYKGPIVMDHYGRPVPKHANGTHNLELPCSSAKLITQAVTEIFDRIVNPTLLIRRITLVVNHVIDEGIARRFTNAPLQLDLFTDYEAIAKEHRDKLATLAKENRMQKALINIKKKYGKNAILKGLDYAEGATMRERNSQIGGHKA